jgi:hypothetical protein
MPVNVTSIRNDEEAKERKDSKARGDHMHTNVWTNTCMVKKECVPILTSVKHNALVSISELETGDIRTRVSLAQ